MVKRVGTAIAGGLIAGAIVGLGEAMYILGGASTGEYGALLYSTVLYGILGAGGGAGMGVGLVVLRFFIGGERKKRRSRAPRPRKPPQPHEG